MRINCLGVEKKDIEEAMKRMGKFNEIFRKSHV